MICPPLFVDLDDSLIATDSLLEGVFGCLRAGPKAWGAFLSLAKGRPAFKKAMAAYVDVAALPLRAEVVALVREEQASGARAFLATGAPERLAQAVADRVGCFDGIIATTDTINRVSEAKLSAIQNLTEGRPFAYLGNGRQDVVIWRMATKSHVVGTWWQRLVYWSRIPQDRRGAFIAASLPFRGLMRACRPEQWAKNLLLALPLLAGHVWVEERWLAIVVGIAIFSAVASAVYLLNDALDAPHDRLHPRKRLRPIAAGEVSLMWALRGIATLLAAAIAGLVWLGSPLFSLCVALYAITAVSYSLLWKRVFCLDLFVLVGLYLLRLFAGAALGEVALSSWLLGVSFFFFLSLACMKRFASLKREAASGAVHEPGRAYHVDDAAALGVVGIGSVFSVALMLSLYLQSAAARTLYADPRYLFVIVPLMIFVLLRAWLLAYRGAVQDDPVAFFLRDRWSYFALGVTVTLAYFANLV